MNKLCIIAKNKETYFIQRLIEEVGRDKIELFDPWSDFLLPDAALYLARTSGVYKSDMDLMIMSSLPKEKVINSVDTLKRFRSKSQQYTWFEEKDFSSLPWLPLKGSDSVMVEKFFRLYPEVVVKPTIGQGGWGILALKWSDFPLWWKKKKKNGDEDYLIQPYIKGAQELRYFFMKGHGPIVLERKVKSGVTANFKGQGEAHLATFPRHHQEELNRLIDMSGAHYGAIDLFIHDGRLIFLELNTVPGIEQLEKVSGQNMAKSFAQTFLSV